MDLRRRLSEAAASAGARVGAGPTGAAAGQLREAVQVRLDALSRPAAPATEPWELSIATLVAATGSGPTGLAGRALGQLDRLGRVAVGPHGLGLDGADAEWGDVRQVRSALVREVLTQSALERELGRLQQLLPPVPGRSWVVGRVAGVLGALVAHALPPGEPGRVVVAGWTEAGRFGRDRTVDAGFAGVLLLAALPEVDRSIRETAAAHGVPVTGPVPGGGADAGGADVAALTTRLADLQAET